MHLDNQLRKGGLTLVVKPNLAEFTRAKLVLSHVYQCVYNPKSLHTCARLVQQPRIIPFHGKTTAMDVQNN